MAFDIGTLVATMKVDDSDFDKKTSSWSTRGAAIGSAFGNIAADAISQASSALVSFVGEAASASDATDKFKKTLEFAGLDSSVIDQYLASTQAYADATVYSLSDIQNITAQLASNGVQGPDALAVALGNLNAIAGGNAETFGRVGSVLTQTTAAGKLTTENWQQLAEAIPGASGKLQGALLQAGAFTGDFRDAMSEGQITAQEFNAALMLVGTDPIAVEAAKSTATFEGAAGNLSAAIQGKLVQALEIVKGPITDFQNGLAWFITNIGQFTPLLTGIGVALLVVFAPAIWAAVVATTAWTVALLANPMTWIIVGIVALVAAVVWLVQNWDSATAWITDVWGGFVGWLGDIVNGIASWWGEVWGGISAFFTSVWDGIVAFARTVWQAYIGWLIDIIVFLVQNWDAIWQQVGSIFTGIWNGIVSWVQGVWQGAVDWILSVVRNFLTGWSLIWSQVGRVISDTWNGIVAWFQSIPGAIGGLLSGAGQWLYSIGRDVLNGFWNGLKSIWSSVSSWFESTFGGIIDTVANLFGIHSPSRVFRAFGINIGEGMIQGLGAVKPEVDAMFAQAFAVPREGGLFSGSRVSSTAPVLAGTTNIVNMTVPDGTSTEEALFAALGSPRMNP
ncbi:phage tail protein [Microbacterium rhizomatis]|uniref:Tape measure protein n=1 Tax=Microbacterium rhizomatis TaxID=1631477 RepID=A0A5J5J4H8_9MICO|nr:tape measure protein [Microbacterium rhizomatis]KAA9110379.1 tape measure protein [Microbacterium rhizomatis]